ncbi:hypothetical protein HN873_045565, partial [Arachis hypogaea]
AAQGGSLGIAFDVIWYEPATNTKEDIEAAQRAQDFQLGWFLRFCGNQSLHHFLCKRQ